MLLPHLDEDVDGVQTCVLGEGPGDALHGGRVGLDGDLLPSADGCGVVAELHGDLHGGGTSAGDHHAVLDGDPDDGPGVHEGPLDLVRDVLGASAYHDGDGLGLLDAGDKGHLLVLDLLELDGVGVAEIVGGQLGDLVDDVGSGGPAEPLHVGLLDTPAGVDALLGEEVLGEVVDSLLAEHDVGSGLLDLLDHALQHVLLFGDELVELVRVGDLDLGVDLGLLDLEGGVDQCDLRVLDALGHAGLDGLLVDDQTLDDVGVLHAGTLLLHGLDVLQVHGVVALLVLVGDGLDGVDDEVGELLFGSIDLLGDHGGLSDQLEGLGVVDGDLHGGVLEDLLGLGVGHPVSFRDDGGVDVGVDQVPCLLQELSGEDHAGGGSVSDLCVLGLGDLDEHLGCGVLDVHLLEDGHSVVGDDDISDGVDEHLVHSTGSQTAPDSIGNGHGGCDVVELSVFALLSLGSFSQDDYGCVAHSHIRSSESSAMRNSKSVYVRTSI